MEVLWMKDANKYENPTFALGGFGRGLEIGPSGLSISRQAESSAPTLQRCRANGGLCRPSFPPSRHDWIVHREYFTQLYQDEERPLKEVMEIMKDRHHFRATYDPLGWRVTMCSLLAV
jgi:hypothetical protein